MAQKVFRQPDGSFVTELGAPVSIQQVIQQNLQSDGQAYKIEDGSYEDYRNKNSGLLSSTLSEEQKKAIGDSQAEIARQKAELAKYETQAKTGPSLEYNPIVEEWVDENGAPSMPNRPGSKKVIRLRDEFQDKGPGKFLESERSRLGQEQTNSLDLLNRQSMQQSAQARAGLASRGGLKGQNVQNLARYSMRDALMGQQNLTNQNATQRSQLESKGNELQMASDQRNLETLGKGATMVNQFNLQKYNKQKEVEAAKLNADATRASASGGKVICNELYLQGLMSKELIDADNEFGRSVLIASPETMIGYWLWAEYVVKLMKKSRVATWIAASIAMPWAKHMGFIMGVEKRDNLLGLIIMAIGLPMCKFLGTIVSRKKEI